ncbi:MAG TPA: ABC transporter substrate-binding protein [Acidimicrobiales bacterium]
MRRLAAIVAVCLTIGSSLSACSGASGRTPVRGGTLNMLGTGDVDYMDPNVSYYTTGYLGLRMWSRQLLTYPAVAGRTTNPVPDLATQVPSRSNGGVSSNGLTYKLTIRPGAMWNTSPPRQVTGHDVVRGVERTCNPAQPFGGLADFETLIAGMQAFCDGFAKVSPTVAAIKGFLASNSVPGIRVDSANPLSVTFTLTRPATYFPNLLAIPALSPAPVEFLNYVPASPDLAQHTVSDGPYEILSYTPAKSIVFVRNRAWNGETDPARKAYVDRIVVSETETQQQVEQQLSTNSPGADMGWDSPIPTASVPAFLAAKNPRLTLGPTFGTDPFLLFDTASPNNGGALRKVKVRQTLEYGINRSELIRAAGGPQVAPPLTHVLPPGVVGSKPADPYPYDPAKARRMLRSDGTPSLRLKVLYQANLDFEARMFQIIQSELGKVGVSVTGVANNSSDFYTKYLEVPAVAHNGTWDLALAQWVPDWYGNAAFSFFFPLFAGPGSFPPQGSNFGFYDDPTTNKLIHEAASTTSVSKAGSLWAQADRQVMADAVIYPITSPAVPVYHAAQVHNAVFVPDLFQFDPTNVWLTPGRNGG